MPADYLESSTVWCITWFLLYTHKSHRCLDFMHLKSHTGELIQGYSSLKWVLGFLVSCLTWSCFWVTDSSEIPVASVISLACTHLCFTESLILTTRLRCLFVTVNESSPSSVIQRKWEIFLGKSMLLQVILWRNDSLSLLLLLGFVLLNHLRTLLSFPPYSIRDSD